MSDELSVADKLRRDLKYADEARARAREVESMAGWISLSPAAKPLLVRVPKYLSVSGTKSRRELELTEADRDALLDFLDERAEHEREKADAIDANCARMAREKDEEKL